MAKPYEFQIKGKCLHTLEVADKHGIKRYSSLPSEQNQHLTTLTIKDSPGTNFFQFLMSCLAVEITSSSEDALRRALTVMPMRVLDSTYNKMQG